MVQIAKQPRVWTGTQWDTLAGTLPDLSNYATKTQKNTATDNADNEVTIASGSFTTASALNISNSLSDTYKLYNLFAYAECSNNAQDFRMRFRENTTDKAANYYAGGNFGTYTGTTGSYANRNNSDNVTLSSFETGHFTFVSLKIFRPNATTGHYINQSWDN